MTDEHRREALALAREGTNEKDLAARYGVHRNTIYRLLKRAGLNLPRHGPRIPLLSPEQEAQILELLADGKGTGSISRELGLPQSRVRQFAERMRCGRYRIWESLPLETRAKVLEQIRLRANHVSDIAAQHDLSYKVLLAVAHEVRGVEKFTPGTAQPPMSSCYPQRHFPDELRK